MNRLHRHVSPLVKSENRLHPAVRVRRLVARAVLLTAFASLSFAAYRARSEDAPALPAAPGLPALSLANPMAGIHPQIVRDEQTIKFNVDGFNRKRERDIANDSERLLSLAISLKADLDKGDRPADAAAKANAIEKLARSVKEKMALNPTLGPI
jgi:hypothetical protein